jgi:putative membrane protein
VYSHGVWFRQEMNIPLDKIQDVSLHHGPVLDALGLATLRVETAGGGQQGSNATLIGVRDAEAFRAAVIARRDAITAAPKPAAPDEDLLREIRDVLVRIESKLAPPAS